MLVSRAVRGARRAPSVIRADALTPCRRRAVFADAARHVASGRSPYARHTYRYTPFLARLLAVPLERPRVGALLSPRYFGKLLFCLADVLCGAIIVALRRRKRAASHVRGDDEEPSTGPLSPALKDALWWLYNPLPINICTRGSAESLVVLLPVLATLAVAEAPSLPPPSSATRRTRALPVAVRACAAGLVHGLGIHAKLYPVIYTVSFMAHFSRQQRQREAFHRKSLHNTPEDDRWEAKCVGGTTFPWRHPVQIFHLAIVWIRRLFFTLSSVLFLVVSLGTVGILTFLAVEQYGQEALDEGLLYHFQRVDHRHNYSMYWYWIYLARGRAEAAGGAAAAAWGHLPLLPQALVLGFSSLGLAPYDLSFALFCQTFAFVAFNKVVTAQYFTWYLCLLPLCSDRVVWRSRCMRVALTALLASIATWLLTAFSLEMLGWRSQRQVYAASLLFFVANVNLLRSILKGYVRPEQGSPISCLPGKGRAIKSKVP